MAMYGQYPSYGMYPQYPQQATNPYLERLQALQQAQLPTYQIARVNGEAGANALQMGPRSEALVLDQSQNDMLIAWYIQTDDAGLKSKMPYVLTPYQPEDKQQNNFEQRLERLEALFDEQSLNGQPAQKQRSSAKRKPADEPNANE